MQVPAGGPHLQKTLGEGDLSFTSPIGRAVSTHLLCRLHTQTSAGQEMVTSDR